MENLIKIIEYINPVQLAAIAVMMWFFYNRLDKKIDNTNHRIDIVEQKLSDKIDKVYFELNEKIEKVQSELNDKIDKKIDKLNDLLSQRIDNLYGFMLNLFQAKRNYDINNDKAA